MHVRGVLGGLAVGVALVGCAAPPQVGAGEPCNSLNECKLGLSCIEGMCDGDLTSIAGQVPVYPGADAAAPAGGDGMSAGTTGGGMGAAAGAGGGGTGGSGESSDAGGADR